MIRGRLRPLTKNAVNGTYAKVLPIDGIFAECSTRRPSDKKLCLGANQTSSIFPSVVAAALYSNRDSCDKGQSAAHCMTSDKKFGLGDWEGKALSQTFLRPKRLLIPKRCHNGCCGGLVLSDTSLGYLGLPYI